MPGKGKGQARGKSRGKSKGKADPVRVQIDVQVRVPKGFTVSAALLDEVRRQWVESGKTPRGFKVSAVHWINPHRPAHPELAKWKTRTSKGGIEHARTSLRLRDLLAAKPDIFRSVGSGKRVRPR